MYPVVGVMSFLSLIIDLQSHYPVHGMHKSVNINSHFPNLAMVIRYWEIQYFLSFSLTFMPKLNFSTKFSHLGYAKLTKSCCPTPLMTKNQYNTVSGKISYNEVKGYPFIYL